MKHAMTAIIKPSTAPLRQAQCVHMSVQPAQRSNGPGGSGCCKCWQVITWACMNHAVKAVNKPSTSHYQAICAHISSHYAKPRAWHVHPWPGGCCGGGGEHWHGRRVYSWRAGPSTCRRTLAAAARHRHDGTATHPVRLLGLLSDLVFYFFFFLFFVVLLSWSFLRRGATGAADAA